MLAGLTKAGSPRSSASSAGSPGVSSCSPNATEPGLRNPGRERHLLRHRLVHAHGRAEDAAADVGHVGQLQHPLDRAVLAEWAVEQRQDDGPSGGRRGVGEHRRGRHDRAGRIEPTRQGVGAGRERRGGSLGDRPLAVGGDPDGRDAVLRRIGGAQHVGGGGARHVVFGRLAAEDHHEIDPIVGHSSRGGPIVVHRPNGTVRPREDSGIGRRRRRRRAPVGPDVEFDGASFDSRSTRPGELFVPIVAERDGHDFIGQARGRRSGRAT